MKHFLFPFLATFLTATVYAQCPETQLIADANTDPSNPILTGPVLGNFTNKTIQLLAVSADGIGAGKSVSFTASAWDASGNRSDASLTLNGFRSETMSEVLNLGLLTGSADLTDIRAIQLKLVTTQNAFNIKVVQLSADCSGSALPVKMTAFSGKYNEGRADLQWSTSSEINADRFEVENSSDGKKFSTLGLVPAKGTSGIIENYNFTYDKPLAGTTYFRLKIIDIDGKYVYSTAIALNPGLQTPDNVTVFPTVFTSQLTLTVPATGTNLVSVRIISVSGDLKYSNSFRLNGNNTINIDGLAKLASGIYIVQVVSGEKTGYKKIIKQ